MTKQLKKLSIFVAGAACAAAFAFGAGSLPVRTYADAEAKTYDASGIFSRNGATIGGETAVTFSFSADSDTISYNRNLALKWYKNGAPEYFNVKFDLDENFSEFTVAMQSKSLTATENDRQENKLVFVRKTEGEAATAKVYVKVNPADDDTSDGTLLDEWDGTVEISLSETSSDTLGSGEFAVYVNGTKAGKFENIGSNYAEYASGSETGRTPLKFSVKKAEGASTAVCTLRELNGQSFALTDGKITDNAVPVLVVDDEFISFHIGSKFALDYKVIDVLDRDSSTLKDTKEYYQWTPVDEEATYVKLDTSTYFLEKEYTENDVKKTVFNDYVYAAGAEHREYVSVKFTLTDASHPADATEDANKPGEYYLAWYMSAGSTTTFEVPKEKGSEEKAEIEFLHVDDSETPPAYVSGDKDDETTDLGKATKAYQALVNEEAKDKKAGSGEKFALPNLKGLIFDDDTSDKSLKYTVCYKTPSNTTGSSSSGLSYNSLELSVTEIGTYEFKVFATDRAGNIMKSAKNEAGAEAEVITTSNIWDHEEIPTFTFTVNTLKTISMKSTTKTSGTGVIDVKYTDISFETEGTAGNSYYGLYYFDLEYFNEKYPGSTLSTGDLSDVSYTALSTAGDIESAAKAYASALVAKLNVTEITADTLLEKDSAGRTILRRINEYNNLVKDDNYPDNKYQWNTSEQSFVPVQTGNYIVFAVFEDANMTNATVAGYKAIDVSDKQDVNPGDSEWLKKNMVSVILFAIAGVMLILIIILLFVKPSDETLEDVGAATAAKKEKKAKKSKKE